MKTRRKFLGSLSALGATVFFSNKTLAAPAKPMLIHQVFFWLKNPEKDMKSMMKGCQDLVKIKNIKKAYIGKPAVTERSSFHVSLTLHFDNIEEHNIYQLHEIHKAFIQAHETKWEKVQVYDIKT